MGHVPEQEAIPSAEDLTYAGDFNWLATRARPGLSYFVSLLASTLTKYNHRSQQLAKEILRWITQPRDYVLKVNKHGNIHELKAWIDAGYGGPGTNAQTGMGVEWAEAAILWRSSRQTVSSFRIAEAELGVAAWTCQVLD